MLCSNPSYRSHCSCLYRWLHQAIVSTSIQEGIYINRSVNGLRSCNHIVVMGINKSRYLTKWPVDVDAWSVKYSSWQSYLRYLYNFHDYSGWATENSRVFGAICFLYGGPRFGLYVHVLLQNFCILFFVIFTFPNSPSLYRVSCTAISVVSSPSECVHSGAFFNVLRLGDGRRRL